MTSAETGAIIIKHSKYARVVELADSLDSGSSAHSGRAGSSPASRTKKSTMVLIQNHRVFSILVDVYTAI